MGLRFSNLLDAHKDPFVPSPEFYQDFRESRGIILNSHELAFLPGLETGGS